MICEEYAKKDSQIKVVIQENFGKIQARYNGVINSSADYITFVDSDDWIAPNTYKALWPYIQEGIDVISYRITQFYNTEYQIETYDSVRAGVYYENELYEKVSKHMIWSNINNGFGVTPSLCNKLFKREHIVEALKSACQINVGYGDDFAIFYPLMMHAHSYAVEDEFGYFYRKRENGKIPDYFQDTHFIEKLSTLYTYVRGQVGENENYIMQLDRFFQHSINFRMNSIHQNGQERMYLFPFEMIPKGSKVILYGAGKVGKTYYNQISESHYCEIIGWIDNNSKQRLNGGIQIANEQIFQHEEFDYVVIAIKNEGVAKQISDKLGNQYDLKPDQIIWKNHEFGFA